MKITSEIKVLIILGVLAIVIFGLNFKPTSLIAIGNVAEVKTNDGITYKFYTTDSYYTQSGCNDVACANYNICNLNSIQIGTEGGCPIYQCSSSGSWQSCTGDIDRCAYGHNCNPSDYLCPRSCKWQAKNLSVQGGINYVTSDNCAYYIEAYNTTTGQLIQRWSKIEEVPGWMESRPYMTSTVDAQVGSTYMSTNGVNYDINLDQCNFVKFVVRDSTTRYKVCIGNLYQPGTTDYSCGADSVVKECNIGDCPSGQYVDTETCSCKPIISVCVENWKCSAWGTCSNNVQTRTCTDQAACGSTQAKPVESQQCTNGNGSIPPPPTPTINDFPWGFAAIAGGLVAAYFMFYKKR